jgi:hypothetical protein
MGFLIRIYRIILQVLCTPVFLSSYFASTTGKKYGIGFWTKFKIACKMLRNNTRIVSGSTFIEHLTMAASLLNIPPDMEGVVVECGTYKGVSAANLSLLCKIMGRRLAVFDSFEGLPAPSDEDKAHMLLASQEIHTYEKGQWCGRLEEVKENIAKYGAIDVCDFFKGYFEDTLPHFNQKCIQVWLDVDFRNSLETCLKYLWPLLQDGCYLYTHEAAHKEIASLFFSESWWQRQLASPPPGLIGAGTGIGIKILSGSSFNSSMGYTVKNPPQQNFHTVPQMGGMKLNLSSSVKLTEKQHG